ncbi:MAG: site-specific integrase [Acidimicrobiia bacterium]|nr:site-specific integrase [Acidimicrobiia bacterium]
MARGDGTYWYDEERGRWFGQLFLGNGPDGRPLRPKRSAKTKAEVRQKLKALQAEHDAGLHVGTDMTVGELAEWWLNEVAPTRNGRGGRPVSETTLDKDRVLVRNHLVRSLGHHKLRDLRPEHVDRMLRHKIDVEGLGHDWVVRLRAKLIEILRQAERRGRVSRNVAALSVMPRQSTVQVRRRSLTVEQARALLDAARGHRLEAMFVVGLMLGLRPGELRGLTWADVDFEVGTIRVSGVELSGRRVDDLKVDHERAKRTLVMPDPVAAALRAHRAQWEIERRELAMREVNDFVFTTSVGTALDRNNVLRTLRGLCRQAGVDDDLKTYELRHTAASLLYDGTCAPRRWRLVIGWRWAFSGSRSAPVRRYPGTWFSAPISPRGSLRFRLSTRPM